MYIPAYHAETDRNKLHDFITQHSFGLLISPVDGVPFATHLPFLLERDAGPHGTLIGHMARANPHWRELESQRALVVFSGPHAFISPAWYDAKSVVPTWNYTAVHAYGKVRLVHDKDALLKIVEASVAHYEAGTPRPWSVGDADEAYIDRLLPQIVGFHFEIDSLEGKFKLSQNQPLERREKVVRGLRERGDADSKAIADLMVEQKKMNHG